MSKLSNNTTKLQNVLDTLANKASGSGGTDTSDATATADEIFAGETAYTADGKVTGTFTINEEVAEQESLIQNIKTALEGKASATVNLQNKTITSNGTYTADSGYDGLGSVTVEVEGSGSTTMVTGTFDDPYESYPNNQLILNDGSIITISSGEMKTFKVAANSVITHFADHSAVYYLSGGITQIKTNNNDIYVYMVTGDFTIVSG